jgi:mannose-6-phosphate isomerase-like protein (cupin superfamily)
MDIKAIKEKIITNVYLIDSSKKVPLHKHDGFDEIFYCVAGEGFGVLQDGDVELKVGEAFIVPSGTMHALKTEGELCVASFLVPVVKKV